LEISKSIEMDFETKE